MNALETQNMQCMSPSERKNRKKKKKKKSKMKHNNRTHEFITKSKDPSKSIMTKGKNKTDHKSS